ncbi:MAG: bifunctional oligoribonuclease/PAP phosphatase NrnA [Promethearchaeota archaeon]
MHQPFLDFFKKKTLKSVLITSHENVDPDGLCSAFAIKSLIHTLYPNMKCEIYFDGLNRISQKIVNKLNLEITIQGDFKSYGIIIVDANSTEQLGELKNQINWENPVLIIDHHVSHPKTKEITELLIINEIAIATTEIILEIYQALNITPMKETASLIFLGLLSDSRHLILANTKTLQNITQLINAGVNYSEMIELLTIPMEIPERIARIKAAQRLTLHRFNEWIIAVSHVSAYEASACRALLNLGVDVAIVFGKKKDEIRVSARSTNKITEKTNLNLARDIMEKIGPIMHGEGGGHDRAAGCNGKDNLKKGIELALKLIKEKLTNKS